MRRADRILEHQIEEKNFFHGLNESKTLRKGQDLPDESLLINQMFQEISSKYKVMFDSRSRTGAIQVYDHPIRFELASNNDDIYLEFAGIKRKFPAESAAEAIYAYKRFVEHISKLR